jgi:CubicO group peptidase (beta-lactamase class C family)
MTTIAAKIGEIQAALDALAKQHKVPGASLGILHGSEVVVLSTGVTNKNTGVPVTPSTLFQIGSNTKLYTATLVMQLVDDGLVDLDAPVKRYLKDWQLTDAKARDRITVRHLMTHTSGIEGDVFDDFGRGDDGIERFVEFTKNIGVVSPPGELWSYCNTGWTMLGRIVEVLREAPYHKVLRERLLNPIGAKATTVLMEEMLAHSCAVGHAIRPGSTEPIVPPMVVMSPSHAPAGSMTTSTPAELLAFVQMHLNNGRAKDTTQVLSAASVQAMQQVQAKFPRTSLGAGMGLGWMLSDWGGERVIGHGGGTIGQLSFLQVLPDRRFGVALFTNCMTGGALWRDLARYLYPEFVGVAPSELPKEPAAAPKIEVKKYAGTYTRYGLEIEVKVEDDGRLVGVAKPTGSMAALGNQEQTVPLRPIDKELFLANQGGEDVLAQFLDFDRSGRPRYLYVGSRVSRRTDDERRAARGSATPSGMRDGTKAATARDQNRTRRASGTRSRAKRPANRSANRVKKRAKR